MILIHSREQFTVIGLPAPQTAANRAPAVPALPRPTRLHCDLCGGRGVVQSNASGDVGAQEYVDCPRCGAIAPRRTGPA